MACEYFIGDKKYSEQEFKQFLAEGGLDEFIASGDVNLTKLTISPIGVKPEPLAQVPAPTIAQQIENFGVSPDMVAPVEALLGKMYENQKQAGLTEATTIEEWLSIGQGEEKPFSLKIERKFNLKQGIADLNENPNTKLGVQELFDSNPELANIGTQEEYFQYLNSIFPDSKVKDIVYHGAMEQLLPKDGKFKGYVTYFSTIKKYSETFGFPVNRKVVQAVVNIKNPYNAPSELADVPEEIHNTDEFTNPRIIKSKKLGYDSVIGVDAGQKEGGTIAIFEPKQIHILGSKQDIEGFKEFTRGQYVEVKSVLPEVVNGFYSNIEKALSQVKQEKMSGNQWATQLLSRGANKEEMKWVGLEGFLKENAAKSISKADIQQYLKDNRIEVVEVVKGNDAKMSKSKARKVFEDKGYDVITDRNGDTYVEKNEEPFDYNDMSELEQNAFDILTSENLDRVNTLNDTRFGNRPDLQLGGQKENYKEILVIMPTKKIVTPLTQIEFYQKELGLTEAEIDKLDDNDERLNDVFKKWGAYQNNYLTKDVERQSNQFKSIHFDEPNILVHLRINTRIDAQGNKVLFLEELQSDWGQTGKKEGFGNKFEVKEVDGGFGIFNKQTGEREVIAGTFNNIEKANERLKFVNERGYNGIPSAPFVTDTNAWTKLGLKVALKEAVAQGADKIAWTTGEQQNERYALSKQVDEISYFYSPSREQYDVSVIKDGKTLQTKTLQEDELEANFGKDVAKRMIEGEGKEYPTGLKSLTGIQLSVGGKGMKGFYGSPTEGSLGIVGGVAKSLFKQEPKTVEINVNNSMPKIQKSEDGFYFISGIEEVFNTKEEAEKYVEENAGDLENEDAFYFTQNAIDVTPELKKQAEEGQPLFKDSQAQFRIEAGKNTIEAIEKFDGSPKAVVALTHEVMHPTIVEIIDGAKNGNEVGLKHANTIVSEYNKANPSKKITLEQLIEDNDKFKEGKTTDAYRDAQEFMADSWETYFKEGAKGFSKAFQEVLDQITAAFRAVYNAISGKQLTPELRAMFDEILGKKPLQKPTLPELKENVKQAKQEVTRAQNALSKARTNLEKAGAEFQIDIYGNAKQNEMMFTPDIKSLNQKVEDAQTELAQAKRQQVKAEDALNAYVPENQLQIKDDNRNAEFGIEPNQPKLPTKDADLPRAIQPTERGAGSELDNEDDGGIGEERVQRLSDLPSNQSLSTDSGKRSPDSFSRGESGVEPGDNTSAGSSQSGLFGSSGVSPKSEPRAGDAKFNSADGSQGQFEDKLAAQKAVNNTPPSEVKLGDIKNIAKTLPYLFDGQIEDIWKAENRLMVDGKKGILFGNQTGTGKTFVFIGTMKRLKLANPNANILVITPKGPLKQTVNAAKVFDLDIKEAKSIKDSEGDMVITTYQNWYQNKGLKSRNWDLVIFDESQNLMENQKGVEKAYVEALRETVATPDESFLKAAQQIVGEKPAFDMVDNSLLKAWEENVEKNKSAIQKRADKLVADTKVILASATPFTHEFSLAYADGIILQIRQGIKAESSGAYNSMDARDMFYISNFGYRMRYNKLTEPDAKVDKDLMLQVFADKMMASGAMSTRLMNVDFDYSREFVLVESKIGEDIDEGISILQEEYKFPVSDAFGYQYLAPLLEAMKAKEMIPRIQAHLNMGRKVVVFHGYNNPIPTHPFGERLKEFAKTEAQYAALLKFWRDHPEYKNLNVGLQNPIETFKQAFGNEAMFYNGEVALKIKEANKDEFNTADGRSLLIVNMAAGGAGLSLHDTVGDKQRVMLNLGLPVRPVFAIQTEGRIYRAGQASNAIFEYPIVNLGFERIIFGTKIAERVNATELLVLGSRARNLREVFRGGYIDATFSEPNEGQGVGGKENDVKVSDISQWDLAKSMYFGQKKGRQNDLGKDYFATPEPIGLKMVQFADLHEGDKMLEPSAGHGAIARFAPDGIELHVIEPSKELRSRLMINISPDRVEATNFEDFNIINKYDAIVMNPPFGTRGKTAVEHVAKAFKHLNDGGRIVAIIPNGEGQTRLQKWFYSEEAANAAMVAEILMPSVMFERAGTQVSTSIYIIDKINNEIVRENLPSAKFIDMSRHTTTEKLFDAMENLTVPARHAVEKFVAQTPLESPYKMTSYKDSKGKEWFVAKPKERVDIETYGKINLIAKDNNGFWLRNAKGFAFKSEDERGSFTIDSEKFFTQKEPERDIDSQIEDASKDLEDFMRNSRSELYANPIAPLVFGAKLAKLMALKIIKGAKTLADAIGQFGITYTPWVRSIWEKAKEIAAKYWAQPFGLKTSKTPFWAGMTANPLFVGALNRAFDGSTSMHQVMFNIRSEIASMDGYMQNNPAGSLRDRVDAAKTAIENLMVAVSGMTHNEAMNFVDDLRRDRLPAPVLYDYAWTEKEKTITHYGFGQRPIETLIKNIRKAGGVVTEIEDPIIGLDLLPGRIAGIAKEFEHEVISSQKGPTGKPIFKPSLIERMVADGLDLGDINGEITVEQNGQQTPGFYLRFTLGYSPVPSFPEYLHALHAKERNDEVALRRQEAYDARKLELQQRIAAGIDVSLNNQYLALLESDLDPNFPLMPDGGSGMTNNEAEDILHDLRVSHPEILAKYDKYAKEFRKEVVEPLQKILVDSQIWSPEFKDEMNEKYPNWVHLSVDFYSDVTGGAASGRAKTKSAVKTVKGSTDRRLNPLLGTIAHFSANLIPAEVNRARIQMFQLIRKFPNENLFKLHSPISGVYYDAFSGEMRVEVKKEPSNSIPVYRNGKIYYIQFKGASGLKIYEAWMNLNAVTDPALPLRITRALNSWLYYINIKFNPTFLFSNLTKDAANAAFNAAALQGIKINRTVIASKSLAYITPSIKAVFSASRGKQSQTSNTFLDYANRFLKQGGAVSMGASLAGGSMQEKIDKIIKLIDEKGNVELTKDALSYYASLLSDAQGAVENGVRLAVFSALVESGISDQQAAAIAKNITVNFDRIGSKAAYINFMIWMFKVSSSGILNFAKFASTPTGMAIGSALFGAGAMLALYNMAKCENMWDAVPQGVKATKAVFLLDCEDLIVPSIPMAHGWSLFFYLGQLTAELSQGLIDAGEATKEGFFAILNNVNPLGSSTDYQSFASGFTPTIVDKAAEFATNRTWFGSPIAPEPAKYGLSQKVKDSENYWSSASEESILTARFLSTLTGGDLKNEGAIDVSPSTLEYAYKTLTGGTGRDVAGAAQLYKDLTQGNKLDYSKYPITRAFTTKISEQNVMTQMYNMYDKYQTNPITDKEIRKFNELYTIRAIQISKTAKSITEAEKSFNNLEKLRNAWIKIVIKESLNKSLNVIPDMTSANLDLLTKEFSKRMKN